jgi:NAD(P)-dependent dehydrogenase (short-subunit alcohol dehydrogenase family)
MNGVPVLLVMGGSRGIGAAVARLAAPRGFDVAVNYRQDGAAAQSVVQNVKATGRASTAIQGDMAQEADVARVIDTAARELGPITHFVYSAGITGKPGRIETLETDSTRQVLDINVLGALLCVRELAPRMSTRQGGRGGAMVLISSMAARLGGGGEYVAYAASKGAVDSMTIGLSRELAADGIRVNAVSPGLIDTEIHAPGRLERIAPTVPLARAGTAEEVAETVLFLLSDAASYVTGTIVQVSGGR